MQKYSIPISFFITVLILASAFSLPVPADNKESELLNMKLERLPHVVQRNIITGETVKFTKKIQVSSSAQGMTAHCRSGGTEYLLPESFECTAALAQADRLEVPLYTNLGEDYAFIELSFPIFDHETQKKVVIEHQVEYPRQQKMSVFYRADKGGEKIWKAACIDLQLEKKRGVNECLLPQGMGFEEDTLEIRVENYAREGKSRWFIDAITIGDIPMESSHASTATIAAPPSVVFLSSTEQTTIPSLALLSQDSIPLFTLPALAQLLSTTTRYN